MSSKNRRLKTFHLELLSNIDEFTSSFKFRHTGVLKYQITFSAPHVLQIFVLLCYKESYIKESEFLQSIFKTWEN